MKFNHIKTNIFDFDLEITAFVSGAVVMLLELVGSRILAPYVGTSIHVWTSLIGVILVSLSLGYWLGGKLALQKLSHATLSNIVFSAGLFISLSALLYDLFVLTGIQYYPSAAASNRVVALVSSAILFTPANILLGMIFPYISQLRTKDIKKTGETVGRLNALSTLGSIVGTFFTGYFLLSLFGSRQILFIIPVLLSSLSLLLLRNKKNFFKIIIFIIIIVILKFGLDKIRQKNSLVDLDTRYNRVRIIESSLFNGRLVRSMFIGEGRSSGVFVDNNETAFAYIKFFRLFNHFNLRVSRSLIIGGAGYVFPTDLLSKNPTIKVDVVEIDPELTRLAKKYFNLKDSPRLSIYYEDGRTFVNRNVDKKKYDAIFVDAYAGSISPPFQLTTSEMVDKLHSMLNEDGIIFTNIISAIEGEKGKLFRAQYLTYKKIFPQVYAFPVKELSGKKRQNIILAAFKSNKKIRLKSESKEVKQALDHLWTKKITPDTPVLTDDFAPVEFF